ncbi:YgiW/YdeI family stress tolerance OB fold protein [Stutzerimonas stutzeri]|uniref:NirD/YgiW/YdeI family stress tolerance protein n=1 Tax=Stutzerimonas stutzeri TaxID=316 RepID=A0A6I6LLJ6_STUST|nr:NirD/YgiW/YdeI family stress tolerance protein [Stutzerimonas stutzeri]QGZ31719.1 NirD/YgiW/YdeI family stress tolerance protein [Stutzerimonas stutzeri]
MKTKTLAALLIASAMTASAFAADYKGPSAPAGGYSGPGAGTISTVAQAKDAYDDAHVVLVGNITKRLDRDDRYEFTDASGSITVDIDEDQWPVGQAVDENTRVRLYGEVDKEMFSVEVDVDRVEVLR